MNIWIINHNAIPPEMGGLVRHYYFAQYLNKKGHHVRIFTSSKIHNTNINMINTKSTYKEETMGNVLYTFVKNRDYNKNGLARIFNWLEFPLGILRIQKKFEKPDLIYTSSPDIFASLFAIKMAKRKSIKSIFEVRDLWPESIVEYFGMSKKNIIMRAMYCMETWLYKNANSIIFTMEGGRDYLIERGLADKIPESKVNHINNGVDVEEFDNNSLKYVLNDFDLEDENFKVIYVGSIRKVNNLMQLVETARILQKRDSTIKVLVYGDGTEKEELENIAKKWKLNNIKFKGRVDKKYVPFILKKSDLNIVTVKESGMKRFGCSWNKLFEYFASGRPVLSDLNVNYNLITSHGAGYTLENSNPDNLADRILEVKNLSKDKYDEMGRNARQLAECYDYSKLGKKLEDIIREL